LSGVEEREEQRRSVNCCLDLEKDLKKGTRSHCLELKKN